MKKLLIGVVGVIVAECVSEPAISLIDDPEISINDGRYEHKEIKLSKIFGINEEMLADTNRFPVSSHHWYEFDLPEEECGFKTVKFSFNNNLKERFGICSIEMSKVLPEDSNDEDLKKEFAEAVNLVARKLGIEVTCPQLEDVGRWRKQWDGVGQHTRPLRTRVYIELSGGYEIDIEAREALYLRRDGEDCLMSNAKVVIGVQNSRGFSIPLLRSETHVDDEDRVARKVEFGNDLSEMLSKDLKFNASGIETKHRSERRIAKLLKDAGKGNVEAMNTLTWSYRFGHDVEVNQGLVFRYSVEVNPGLAFKYSKMAADLGDAKGIANLASCYEDGCGVAKDAAKAAELWKKAAQKGNAWAVSRYAKCLAEGKGIEQNPKEAARLYEMCAARKNANSSDVIQIASFYLRGFGVEKDEKMARKWLDKLETRARNNDWVAIADLAEFYLDGEKGVGKDAARAFEMSKLAEKTDTALGYRFMARCYKDGIGVEKNVDKAKEYVYKALSKGVTDAELKELNKILEDIGCKIHPAK